MLTVLETATGQEHGQVRGFVRVGVSEVAAEKDHGAFEQRLTFFLRLGQALHQVGECLHALVFEQA